MNGKSYAKILVRTSGFTHKFKENHVCVRLSYEHGHMPNLMYIRYGKHIH